MGIKQFWFLAALIFQMCDGWYMAWVIKQIRSLLAKMCWSVMQCMFCIAVNGLSLQCVIRASQKGVSSLTLLCLSNKKHPQHWRNDSFNRSPSYSEELPHDFFRRCSEFTWALFHNHSSPSSLQGSINVYSNKKDGSRDEPALNATSTEKFIYFPTDVSHSIC